MKVTVLGSGSSGNSILVESDRTRLLIDAGFSGRDLERRLAAVGREPSSIDALFVTHEHGDHTQGIGIVARRWGIPLYLGERTRVVCGSLLTGTETIHHYGCADPVRIGDLRVEPFLTVHDAVDPFAVTVTEEASGEKLGIATDLGRPTVAVRHALRDCDMLILEANHDEIMLRESAYPWSVKLRIGGSHGHLSNRAAAELVAGIAHPGLATVVLAHLSEQANDPGLAADVVGQRLERLRFAGTLLVARQPEPIEPIDVGAGRRRLAPAQLPLL
ncbi:MAG TPA: MBL fold metallo-hydrolase [Longimicrobiaceae bacterium]|nr:MBL fold metallo-hydrolase [Longimicrobiaceae bacterium]